MSKMSHFPRILLVVAALVYQVSARLLNFIVRDNNSKEHTFAMGSDDTLGNSILRIDYEAFQDKVYAELKAVYENFEHELKVANSDVNIKDVHDGDVHYSYQYTKYLQITTKVTGPTVKVKETRSGKKIEAPVINAPNSVQWAQITMEQGLGTEFESCDKEIKIDDSADKKLYLTFRIIKKKQGTY